MEKRSWKPLVYNGLDLTDRFLVSDSGEIYSLKSKKILKQVLNKSTGYYGICVSLGSRENKMYIKIHIAVACMFVGGREDGLVVNHKDGNKQNNHFENLEWISNIENIKHANRMGLVHKGDMCYNSKIKNCDVVKIREMYKSGLYTQKKIGEIFGIDHATVHCVVSGKTYKNV